jgi:hypothetical protein
MENIAIIFLQIYWFTDASVFSGMIASKSEKPRAADVPN